MSFGFENISLHKVSPFQIVTTSRLFSQTDQKISLFFKTINNTIYRSLPETCFQQKLDELGSFIQSTFQPLRDFNNALNNNGKGSWENKLAQFLVKLPIRSARNIVVLLYNVISNILYAFVHPLQGLNHLIEALTQFFYALTKPETWSKIGSGMIGASLGTAVLGNPLSLTGLLIGTALTISGLTAGVIKTAYEAKKGTEIDNIWHYLLNQTETLLESMLTAFFMGLMIGSVQRAQTIKAEQAAKNYVDQLAQNAHYRDYEISDVQLDPLGNITFKWHFWLGEREYYNLHTISPNTPLYTNNAIIHSSYHLPGFTGTVRDYADFYGKSWTWSAPFLSQTGPTLIATTNVFNNSIKMFCINWLKTEVVVKVERAKNAVHQTLNAFFKFSPVL